ncbi:molybdopterin oxidoreductase family protein [Microbacterium amylolyticum]|uniref:Assimilatory nitrate reductase catalytic subunit n=1 Tax=Microbacterium amylolyticum TaxID=936337 RepID=A0ABS4ZET5_9MICO|nr:molybdopterin oxidoreductase family protein [Microbacterium amylolyticum]MBP2435794.1 assimilatory nitrate reductase catalytic subunit [Microbacterium amylolyticum]
MTSQPLTAPTADTHCPYCALQCAMTLTATPGERLPVEVSGREFPTNRGGLCKKGWTSAELLSRGDRLTSPLVKQPDGSFAEASWDEVLDRIATTATRIQADSGRDAVGIFGGGGLTNEKSYQLGKFARIALRTSRIDYNGRFCMSSAAAAANRSFGLDRGLPFPLADLGTAEAILVLGSNMGDTMPPFVQHLQGARARGGLIVVDPRMSTTARLTNDGAGTHIAPVAGTDLALLLGLSHIVLNEGLADERYLEERTTGLAGFKRSVAQWWPARTESVTGVPSQTLRDVAHRLAAAKNAYILTGRGVEQHSDGTDTATAAINLALLLGLVGREGSGYGTLTGQGNGQGGREHGQKSDQLPGYRKITDPAARAHVARVWGVVPEIIPGPGLPAVQLLQSCGEVGGVRMLLVHGSNVVVSAPDVSQVRESLSKLDLLVVSDFFLSETAQMADIVLPVLQWAEEEGTMTNLEGRVIRRRKAVTPPDGARSELWILRELAQRLEAPGTWSLDPSEVFDELARASAGGLSDYSGLSHALLDTGIAAHWPYAAGSDGTPRLFQERFAHADGRARLVAVRAHPPEAPRGADLNLITGRLLEHYQSGAQTRRVAELNDANSEIVAQIHPVTAQDRGIADGGRVRVANARGVVEARVKVTRDIRPDTVFLPFHFAGDESANLLTSAKTDPISSMPEFKNAVVTVEALTP